jgi:hypothetical protein
MPTGMREEIRRILESVEGMPLTKRQAEAMARSQVRRQRQPLILEVVGKRLSRSVGSAEDGLIHRLRQMGVDPNAIHMPPPIEDIEAGVLPPPQPAEDVNLGFLERQRRQR